jgi:uncharacterized protein (TIGR04255 family)
LERVDEHEVYPSAPVVLVAAEIRHPPAEPLARSEVMAVKRSLSNHTPIARPGQMQTIEIVGSPTGNEQKVHVERFPRLVNRQSTLTVSYRETAIVVETTDYPGWSEFREIVGQAIAGRAAVSPVDGVERVGIRYIDEIRVPHAEDEVNWSDWMHDSVLGPTPSTEVGLPLAQWQGVGIFGTQPGHMMVMRYGPQVGAAVDSTAELRRVKQTEGGAYFLVDIDSFWTPDGGTPELNQEVIMATCDDLHRPVRTMFEGLINDKLRDEVFRK